MPSKQEQLKKLNAEKKALNEKQKAIREELNKNKDERIKNSKAMAKSRKQVKEIKSDLRDLTSNINNAFKDGDPKKINTMADEIMETATELASSVRSFAEAKEASSKL